MGTVYTLSYNPYSEYATDYNGNSPSQGYINAYNWSIENGLFALTLHDMEGYVGNFYCTALTENETKFALVIQPDGGNIMLANNPFFGVRPFATQSFPVTSGWFNSFAVRNVRPDGAYGASDISYYGLPASTMLDYYTNLDEALIALGITSTYPITYRDTNCVSSGPVEADVGDVVQVEYTFPEGYGIVNPSTDIYVTNNGVVVPSSYSNGTLTFTMPDPS